MQYKASIDLIGIPAHAWSMRTAELLVADFGYIVSVSPMTSEILDMTLYKILLCVRAPGSIPKHRWIEIPENTDEFGNLEVFLYDSITEISPSSLAHKVTFRTNWIHQMAEHVPLVETSEQNYKEDASDDEVSS